MGITFHANCVAVENMDEDQYWLVGFADHKFEPKQYLMLHRSYEDDEPDVTHGMDTYFVERDGQQWSCYGGIDCFELSRDRVTVRFDHEGARRLETDVMSITFKIDDQTFANLKGQLERVFAGTQCLVLPP